MPKIKLQRIIDTTKSMDPAIVHPVASEKEEVET
jgi:hypothetical protein